jgi:hypothetical protein
MQRLCLFTSILFLGATGYALAIPPAAVPPTTIIPLETRMELAFGGRVDSLFTCKWKKKKGENVWVSLFSVDPDYTMKAG